MFLMLQIVEWWMCLQLIQRLRLFIFFHMQPAVRSMNVRILFAFLFGFVILPFLPIVVVIIWFIYGIVMDSIAKANRQQHHNLDRQLWPCEWMCVCLHFLCFVVACLLLFSRRLILMMCKSVTTVSMRFIRYKYEIKQKMTPFDVQSFFFFLVLPFWNVCSQFL